MMIVIVILIVKIQIVSNLNLIAVMNPAMEMKLAKRVQEIVAPAQLFLAVVAALLSI